MVKRHVYLWTVVSVSYQYKNPTWHVGLAILYFPYIFKILLYFLYLSEISYITSQNRIFSKTMRKKVESFILSENFI